MKFDKNNLIKSPLNYTGGKFKLLPQILPLFPENIETFYDLFGGGGDVIANVSAKKHYYNDIIHYISKILKGFKNNGCNGSYIRVLNVIKEYELSNENLEGFQKLRSDYNKGENDWEYLYALLVHSFNCQLRFNNNQQYNSSFGKRWFNERLQDKFLKFSDRIHKMDISFNNHDFRELDISSLNNNDFVYLDPPYTLSNGIYQDGKRGFKGWNVDDEPDLFDLCDQLDSMNIKFSMSNLMESKGIKNKNLLEWSGKYNVNYLNISYKNSNHQRKNKNDQDLEVLITNY